MGQHFGVLVKRLKLCLLDWAVNAYLCLISYLVAAEIEKHMNDRHQSHILAYY